MGIDRITELRVSGVRTLDRIVLKLSGLTVLIGENGAGKSTALECLEILRGAAERDFGARLLRQHGAPAQLFRSGGNRFELGVCIEGDGVPLRYSFVVERGPFNSMNVVEEVLEARRDSDWSTICSNKIGTVAIAAGQNGEAAQTVTISTTELAITWLEHVRPEFARARSALRGIDVHVAFALAPSWAGEHVRTTARQSTTLERVDRLSLGAANLASAFHSLHNDYGASHWDDTMALVRLGLGDAIDTVNTPADPSGGSVGLALKLRGQKQQVYASAISDGMLAYLAFVALFRLDEGRSLLAFDEPDLHLHPALASRVIDMFSALSRKYPVVLATQSDAVLDALADPCASTVVCRLRDDPPTTSLLRLDRAEFNAWREQYRGLGDLRSAGYLDRLIDDGAANPSSNGSGDGRR